MKKLTTILVLLLSMNSFGQNSDPFQKEVAPSLEFTGHDNSQLLNGYEATFLNFLFRDARKSFDFAGKRVGFLNKTGGKVAYFDMHKKHIANTKSPYDKGMLYIFDAAQRKENGGYDAAIVYWSKLSIPINEVVKKLKRNTQ